MKNYFYITFLGIIAFYSNKSNAQLFVKDSYVYVADNYIYVKQDIELNNANSNIYLRNGAQLLQGTAGAGTNKGFGALSVFQEGTANGFAYNGWCSPVGEPNATAANSAFSINQIGVPNSRTATTFTAPQPWNAPTGTGSVGSAAIASRWIYKFISSLNYADWAYVGTSTNLNAGEGFLMKGVSGSDPTTAAAVQADGSATNNPGGAQRLDFRGKPNDGDISVSLIANKQTLSGNPYPSAIDMDVFLSAAQNPNCDGTAQYWEQPNANAVDHFVANYKGGYGIYNGLTHSYTPAIISSYDGSGTNTGTFLNPNLTFKRKFCPVAQGFMLTGSATSTGTITFKNTHRVVVKEGAANFSEFQKQANVASTNSYGNYPTIPNVAGTDYAQISKAPTPQIILKTLINNDMVRQSSICFLNSAIDGVDRADSKSPTVDDNLPFDQYFYLGDTEFVQSTTRFDINKKFALGFKNTTQTTFKIKVSDEINFTAANNIYIHDKDNDLYYDIKNQAYEFSLPAGVNNVRFEITFTQGALSSSENSVASFDVFQNNVNGILTIRNPKLTDISTLGLFDITGKLIFNKTDLGNQSQFDYSTENLSEGVYIVNIKTTDNQKIVRKVIISKIK